MVIAGEAEFSNKMKFRVLWKTNRPREALSSQGQISREKKASSYVVVVGEAEFSNKMKFRVLWETKAARKVLASCGGLARGAEVSGNSSSRSNHGLHPTRLSPPKIGGLTRFQSVL